MLSTEAPSHSILLMLLNQAQCRLLRMYPEHSQAGSGPAAATLQLGDTCLRAVLLCIRQLIGSLD